MARRYTTEDIARDFSDRLCQLEDAANRHHERPSQSTRSSLATEAVRFTTFIRKITSGRVRDRMTD